MRFVFALLLSATAVAQPWPTTDWVVLDSSGTTLTGDRAVGGRFYEAQLRDASQWLQSLGFPAPAQIREDGPPSRYVAYLLRSDARGAVYYNPALGLGYVWDRMARSLGDGPSAMAEVIARGGMTGRFPPRTFWIEGSPRGWATRPGPSVERMVALSPVHELFHGIQAAYGPVLARPVGSVRRGGAEPPVCEDDKQDSWIKEGMASAVQVRYLERVTGAPYPHWARDPSRFSWMRYFDDPLHQPRHPYLTGLPNRAYLCGYGTWIFWTAVGEMLGAPDGIAHLHHVLAQSRDWSDYGLRSVDDGLRAAARAYGAALPYDGGLGDLYPRFIARYADAPGFYAAVGALAVSGGASLAEATGEVEPLAATAWSVSVSVPDDLAPGATVPVRVSLEPGHETGSRLHLIDGSRLIPQPPSLDDAYGTVLRVARDTTLFLRVANAAEDAPTTRTASYTLRVEVGGFYGVADGSAPGRPEVEAPVPGAVAGPVDVRGDVPPGIALRLPDGTECVGGPDGGSFFDLVTPEEVLGDARREALGALDTWTETVDPAALLAMARRTPGVTAEEIREMEEALAAMPSTEAEVHEARAQIERELDAAEPGAEGAYLELFFVGQTGGRAPCRAVLHAALADAPEGDLAVSQTLTAVASDGGPGFGAFRAFVASSDRPDPWWTLYGGRDGAYGLVLDPQPARFRPRPGAAFETEGTAYPWGVCAQSAEERAYAGAACGPVCPEGTMALDAVGQGVAVGRFEVAMVRRTGGEDVDGCPLYETGTLSGSFRLTSLDEGRGDNGLVRQQMLRFGEFLAPR